MLEKKHKFLFFIVQSQKDKTSLGILFEKLFVLQKSLLTEFMHSSLPDHFEIQFIAFFIQLYENVC